VFLAQADDLTTTNNAPAPANQMTLAPLVSFVLKSGGPSIAESYIIQNLNLGSKNMAVIQKGWKSRNDNLNHLVAVSKANNDDVLILIFNDNIDGVCWLTSKSGQIRSTVVFSRSTHTSHAKRGGPKGI
jgi:hypothetical protein